jgi:hypothetical protein
MPANGSGRRPYSNHMANYGECPAFVSRPRTCNAGATQRSIHGSPQGPTKAGRAVKMTCTTAVWSWPQLVQSHGAFGVACKSWSRGSASSTGQGPLSTMVPSLCRCTLKTKSPSNPGPTKRRHRPARSCRRSPWHSRETLALA